MPSTIDSSSEFQVDSDLERCWDFFANLQNIGWCIPGCESVTFVDEKTAVFKVKLSVGYISKTFELRTRFKDVVPRSQVSFVGEGSDAQAIGTVSLRTGDRPGVTKLGYRLQIKPVSAVGRTAAAMLGDDLVKKQAEAFVRCVKAKLETASR